MRQATRTIALAALCVTATVANAKPSEPQQQQPSKQPQLELEDGNKCPYAMRGVKLTAELDKHGVVFEFTNPRREYVKDVRDQLREAAELIQELSRLDVDDSKLDPDAPRLPPLAITVKDIQSGARVVVHAVRMQDRAELRELAAGFAEFWVHSDCAVDESISV